MALWIVNCLNWHFQIDKSNTLASIHVNPNRQLSLQLTVILHISFFVWNKSQYWNEIKRGIFVRHKTCEKSEKLVKKKKNQKKNKHPIQACYWIVPSSWNRVLWWLAFDLDSLRNDEKKGRIQHETNKIMRMKNEAK